MNIKQAAEQSGVSGPNIRFYEKEGLMTPARNRGNAYRDYTAKDIRTLKLIRMLRMLDMPLPVIQRVLNGEQPLTEALQAQQEVLEQQAAQLAGAIRFCAELTQQAPQVDQLDVDDCLKRMQDPQEPGGFFSGWLRDYRTVAENEQKKRFFIVSEQSINTPEDFAAVLLRYGEAQGSPVRITKGGMYPEFEWNGIRYQAWRGQGRYSDSIFCEAILPGSLQTGLPPRRERLLRWMWRLLPVAVAAMVLGALVLRGRM